MSEPTYIESTEAIHDTYYLHFGPGIEPYNEPEYDPNDLKNLTNVEEAIIIGLRTAVKDRKIFSLKYFPDNSVLVKP